ncbi:hypothetical protein NECAME_08711 [Necator americanus]|uniref:Uncharacterized protein n=1 Tax=Necator americanus TaxID=51031 RepID=W2TIY9_NECAM|nr:hypothetical protein NECAME_08711 [Necator americanus]ETN81126.1 hypothetical protein NECAME_08711 [Necator americanus]
MGFNVSFQALAGLDAFCGERFWVLAVLLAFDSLFLLIASFIQAATDRIPFAVDIVYPLMLFLAMVSLLFLFGFHFGVCNFTKLNNFD